MDILKAQNDAKPPRSVDYYFHYKLAEVSKNVFYMNFIDTYYDLIAEIADRSHKDETRRSQIEREHLEIAKALIKRDKKAAIEAVRHHLEMVDKSIR
jgi:GntR family transcriptional repressor for pyruvate dehydrogenase complex